MRTIWCVLILALVAGPVLAQADQIVHFINGTSMPIRSHSVADGMIHVDLGTNSYMAFPISMVAKVTKAGEEIDLTHSAALRNKMAAEHRSAAAELEQLAESTSVEPEVLTREEKLRRYTDRVRNRMNGATGSNGEQPPHRSTSAAGVRLVDTDGTVPVRSHTVGAQPNLSGARLGYIRPSNRKTVGGKIIDARTVPNNSKVELVSKSRAVKSKTGRKSGSGN